MIMVQTAQLKQIIEMSTAEVHNTLSAPSMPGIPQSELDTIRAFLIRKSRIVTETGNIVMIDLFQKHEPLILKAIAQFKRTAPVKNKTVTPASMTTTDTIGIETLDRPQIFGISTFRKTGLTPGIIPIITDPGNPANPFTLDAQGRERIILLGFMDLIPGSGITGIRVVDDGNRNALGENTGYQLQPNIAARFYELEVPRIVDQNLFVEARLSEGNSTWLVPIGVRVADGLIFKPSGTPV